MEVVISELCSCLCMLAWLENEASDLFMEEGSHILAAVVLWAIAVGGWVVVQGCIFGDSCR